MKKVLIALSIVCTTVVMVSCKSGGGGATPTAALKAMSVAAKDGDFTAITKQLCKSDREMMEKWMPMMESAAKLTGKNLKDLMKEEMSKDDQFNMSDVEFKNEKITGDNATVDTYNKKKEKTETITLKKEDGVWRVCMGIADKAKDAMGGKSMDEGLKEVQDAMKNITPEQMEQAKKAIEQMGKNMTPEQMEQAKKLAEQLGKGN